MNRERRRIAENVRQFSGSAQRPSIRSGLPESSEGFRTCTHKIVQPCPVSSKPDTGADIAE
jgi:hypothetical protein